MFVRGMGVGTVGFFGASFSQGKSRTKSGRRNGVWLSHGRATQQLFLTWETDPATATPDERWAYYFTDQSTVLPNDYLGAHLLKLSGCHDANFVATCGIAGCLNGNLLCHQWRQSWTYYISRVFMSKNMNVTIWLLPWHINATKSPNWRLRHTKARKYGQASYGMYSSWQGPWPKWCCLSVRFIAKSYQGCLERHPWSLSHTELLSWGDDPIIWQRKQRVSTSIKRIWLVTRLYVAYQDSCA